MMAENYYLILDVDPEASPSQIKSAYRKKVKELHPDYFGKDSGPFLAVQEAYDVLSDPARRRIYDRDMAREKRPRTPQQPGWTEPPDPGGCPVEPLIPTGRTAGFKPGSGGRFSSAGSWSFQEMVEHIFGNSPWPGSRADRSIQVEIALSPEQARQGGRIRIPFPVQTRCQTCRGRGGIGFFECPDCFGAGVVTVQHPLAIPFPPGVSDADSIRAPLDRLGLYDHFLIVHFHVG